MMQRQSMAYVLRKGTWQRRLLTTLVEDAMPLSTKSLFMRCGATSTSARCAATHALTALTRAQYVHHARRGVWQVTPKGQQLYVTCIVEPEIDALYRQLDARHATRRAGDPDPGLDAQIPRLAQRLRTLQAHEATVLRGMARATGTSAAVDAGLAILHRVEERRQHYSGLDSKAETTPGQAL